MTLQVVDYNPEWPRLYKEEVERLGPGVTWYHIGSTSVPGLAAKPIIDILGVVDNIASVDRYPGYQWLGHAGIPRRRLMRKPGVNLHIYEEGNPQIMRHLLFCDYLRRHPEEAARYGAFKRQLAQTYADDVEAYNIEKSSLIAGLDNRALAEWKGPLPHWQGKFRAKPAQALESLCDASYLEIGFFAHYNPDMRIQPVHGLTLVSAPLDDVTFNTVIGHSPINAAQVSAITDVVKLSKRPFSWWLDPRLAETATPLLEEAGWHPMEPAIGMMSTLKRTYRRPDGIYPITNFQDFAKILITCGEHPQCYDLIWSHFPTRFCELGGPFEWYVRYDGEKPVTTGMIIFFAGVAFIAYISTVPEARAKGHGMAMMEFLCSRIQERGYSLAVLWASSMGKSLYSRCGFNPFTRITEYSYDNTL